MKGLEQVHVDLQGVKRRLTRLYTMERIPYDVMIDIAKDTNEVMKKVEAYIVLGVEVEYEPGQYEEFNASSEEESKPELVKKS